MCQHCLHFIHCPLVANQKTRWSIEIWMVPTKNYLYCRRYCTTLFQKINMKYCRLHTILGRQLRKVNNSFSVKIDRKIKVRTILYKIQSILLKLYPNQRIFLLVLEHQYQITICTFAEAILLHLNVFSLLANAQNQLIQVALREHLRASHNCKLCFFAIILDQAKLFTRQFSEDFFLTVVEWHILLQIHSIFVCGQRPKYLVIT